MVRPWRAARMPGSSACSSTTGATRLTAMVRASVLRDGLDAGDLDHAGVVDQMRGSPAARASARSTERKVSPGNRDSGAPG